MPKLVQVLLAVALWPAAACGGSSGAGPLQPAGALSVGGSYATAVSIQWDSCGGAVVMSNPTTVTHVPGATTLALVHAGTTYTGSIATSGTFTATTPALVVGATTYNLAISGGFTMTGFAATVIVTQTDGAHPTGCRYAVRWIGTRSSGVNTIPG